MSYAKLLDLTPAQYHKDFGAEVPRLSVSIAKILLEQSPMHARWAHPLLGGGAQPPTDATDSGSVIHKLLLGKGAEVAVLPYDDYRKKEAQEARDAAVAAGKIPVKSKDWVRLELAADAIRRQYKEMGIDFETLGVSEQAIEWDEPGRRGPVRCKAMFDLFVERHGRITDVKSISSASFDSCARSMWKYGYYIQEAAYKRSLTALTGRPSEMLFLFCELEAPFGVLPAIGSGAFRELGENAWQRAVHVWEDCLHSGKWPGYATDGVARLEPPAWAMKSLIGDEWQ